MNYTISQREVMDEASMVLTQLMYHQATNPIERAYLQEVRAKLDAVRVMTVTEKQS